MEIIVIILTILAVALGLYHYRIRDVSYFKENRLPHDRPLPIFGNLAAFFFRRKPVHLILADMYNKYSQTKYFGFYDFRSPIIILRDPELINSIAIKNFDNFTDHTSFVIEHEPLLAKNLFQLRGDNWREMRKMLSPTFTSSKMKMMFGLIQECADNFVRHIANKSVNGWTTEMKDIFSNYTNDVVATTAFGIRIDSMKDPNNEFITLVKKVLNFDSILSLKLLLGRNFPWLFKLFRIKLFGDKVHNFFRKVIIDNIKTRQDNGINRPDMIQLMMESRDKMQLTYDDMTSQAFLFFLAGSDATSTFMSFFTYELALNTEVQNKLRDEIDECLKLTNGKPTYDVIMNMKYLDAVINETLRLYPLTVFVDRFCSRSFELPPAIPGDKSFTIKPGMSVWFLPYAIHRDPKYYPNPDKFDPNRFIDGNIDPLVYFPFGIGPRICIGNRYALIICKVVFFYFVANCEFKISSKTQIPMKYSKKSMVMTAENGLWLKIQTRKDKDN
ncbi:PREDICTED: cytochrome P450 9e2-like [Polistes canadensis]|uniref:cytochrome P450 9e2-like n=1 Tax=Polistes canadensis TaxID=91411 RepID=UPI000718D727|nr:PREDICTED: cytochrome P450 9e2-like [Polistes canadensis]